MPDNVVISTLSDSNKEKFLKDLENSLFEQFNITDKNELPENYGCSKDWGLLSLIKYDKLDTYQLLYINGKPESGCGGILREYDGQLVYQGLFRGFSLIITKNKALCNSSVTIKHMLPYQIEKAKQHGCKKLIISYNIYNYRLFLAHKYFIKRNMPNLNFVTSETPQVFNGVEQWLITCPLE
jgi:hypothetical protein